MITKNNKCFILYDGLVSFLLLSTFICFFLLIININQNNTYFNNIKLEALSGLRNSAYNYYKTGTWINFETENIYSNQEGHNYCIYYKVKDGYEKLCIK